MDKLVITERELKEIHHCLLYVEHCNHGTVGHNLLVLTARLATHLGFRLNLGGDFGIPVDRVEIIRDSR